MCANYNFVSLRYNTPLKKTSFTRRKIFQNPKNMPPIQILSIPLFIIGLFLYRKKSKNNIFTNIIFAILYFVSIFLYIFYLGSDYLTGAGITEATMYHLSYGLEGSGFSVYWKAITSGLAAIAISLFIFWKIIFYKGKNVLKQKIYLTSGLLLIFISLIFNPATLDLFEIIKSRQAQAASEISVSTEIKKDKPSFENFYKEPSLKKIGKSKNLVFIYLEGLEQTYSDENIFPGLTKNLNDLQSKNTHFSNIIQTYGADYTIAGMVASQCGIPLTSPSHGNSLSGMDEFLPGATCLGDLLHQEDYHLSYFGGGSLEFAGKGKFYDTHYFDEMYGVEELLPELDDKSYKTGWGLYDDTMLDLAYKKLENLSNTEDKFALFLLTLDTHHPNGHISNSCNGKVYQDGKNSILNAVYCTDILITDFIKKIQSSNFAKDTTIVIASDHLALRNTATKLLDTTNRTNRLMILTPDNEIEVENKNLGSTLDTSATILPYLGFETEGGLGLGRDLNNNESDTEEKIYIYSHIPSWRKYLQSFFNFPKIEESLSIKIQENRMQIDNRSFRIPALLEIGNDLHTKLKFQFDLSGEEHKLANIISKYEKNQSFILIDKCENTTTFDDTIKKTKYCIVAGKKEHNVSFPVIDNMYLNIDDVARLTGL